MSGRRLFIGLGGIGSQVIQRLVLELQRELSDIGWPADTSIAEADRRVPESWRFVTADYWPTRTSAAPNVVRHHHLNPVGENPSRLPTLLTHRGLQRDVAGWFPNLFTWSGWDGTPRHEARARFLLAKEDLGGTLTSETAAASSALAAERSKTVDALLGIDTPGTDQAVVIASHGHAYVLDVAKMLCTQLGQPWHSGNVTVVSVIPPVSDLPPEVIDNHVRGEWLAVDPDDFPRRVLTVGASNSQGTNLSWDELVPSTAAVLSAVALSPGGFNALPECDGCTVDLALQGSDRRVGWNSLGHARVELGRRALIEYSRWRLLRACGLDGDSGSGHDDARWAPPAPGSHTLHLDPIDDLESCFHALITQITRQPDHESALTACAARITQLATGGRGSGGNPPDLDTAIETWLGTEGSAIGSFARQSIDEWLSDQDVPQSVRFQRHSALTHQHHVALGMAALRATPNSIGMLTGAFDASRIVTRTVQRGDHIDVIQHLSAAVHPLTIDTHTTWLLPALKHDDHRRLWNTDLRVRPLAEATGLTRQQLHALANGWTTASLLGRIDSDNGAVWLDGTWREIPSLLIGPTRRFTTWGRMAKWDGWLLVALRTLPTLLGRLPEFQDSVTFYEHLLAFGGLSAGSAGGSRPAPMPHDDLSRWLQHGEVASGAPTPDIDTAGPADGTAADRSAAICRRLDAMQVHIDGLWTDYLAWCAERQTVGGQVTPIQELSEFFRDAVDRLRVVAVGG